MREEVSLLVSYRGIALALVMATCLLVGCQREERDWKEAKAAGTLAAFREFAGKHPDGIHAPLVDNEVFLLETSEERARMLKERIAAIADGKVESFAISGVPAAKSGYSSGRGGPQVSGTQSSRGGYSLSLTGHVVPTNAERVFMTDAVMLGIGTYAVRKDIRTLERRPVVASMTFTGSQMSAADGPLLVVSTELAADRIPLGTPAGVGMGGSDELIVPSGSGSIFKIVGSVAGLAADAVITGDGTAGIYFGLLEDKGLVYLYGKGTVERPNQNLTILPAQVQS